MDSAQRGAAIHEQAGLPLQGSSSNAPGSSPRSSLARGELAWLAAVILIAIGLRILWVAHVNVDPNDGRGDDTVHYHNMAHLLAEGMGYVNWVSRFPTAHWPPAYPAALAVLYKLFGWHLVLAKGLNIAFAAATVGLTYLIARRIFDRRVAHLGALLLAFFPGQIYFSTLVMTETMFGLIFMLVLLLALVWTSQASEARWWQTLLLGFLVGLGGMVRAEGVFLVFVLVALWALTVRPWRRVGQYGVLLALGTALALTPWTVRNAVQLHQFVPLRAYATVVVARALDPEAVAPAIRLEDIRLSTSEGLEYQVTHPWEIPRLVSRRIARLYENDSDAIFWIQNRANAEPPLTKEEVGVWRGLADRYFFAAGAAALLAAGLSLLRQHRASLVLIVAGAGWTLLFGFITPDTRFHFPVGLVISVLAAAFLVFIWEGAKRASRWLLTQIRAEYVVPARGDPPSDESQ